MSTFLMLTKRNMKMFFKDKGMFFTSLITPVILLVLYSTFLAGVYQDSFESIFNDYNDAVAAAGGQALSVPEKLINSLVGGQLISSLLAVCCITVAFCSNILMAADKVSGARKDLLITPVNKSTLSLAYYTASFVSTLIITLSAAAVCFLYVAIIGWYYTFADVLIIISDVILLTLFGTALSSVINTFLNTQGQISAVGTIVSAGYGFICGAYMPISSFGSGLQTALSFLPGTYATSLLKNHALNAQFKQVGEVGFSEELVKGVKEAIDCEFKFFNNSVSIGAMYAVLVGSIILLVAAFVLIEYLRKKRR